jgi:glycosyltransferase involved in cell wall biosynthesis
VIEAVGIVVPAHDEEVLLPACLAALREAARAAAAERGVGVRIVVAADACADRTVRLARQAGATVVEITARNVGAARAAGMREILGSGPPGSGPEGAESLEGAEGVWLATTDADSVVPPDWLTEQLRYADQGWEAVVGTVAVADWTGHGPATAIEFAKRYGMWQAWHPHVHGANLGFTAAAYLTAGGFPPLRTAEDHALVSALHAQGSRVLRTPTLRVVTSARRQYRAPAGFGELLTTLGSDPGPLLGARGGDGGV